MMQELPYRELGTVLDRERISKGYTEAELAWKCGVRQTAVYYWLSGLKRPRPIHLALLAALLGLDPGELAILAKHDEHRQETTKWLYDRWFSPLYGGRLPRMLQSAEDRVHYAERLRISGSPQDAITIATQVIQELREEVGRQHSRMAQKQTLHVLALALNERAFSNTDVALPTKALTVIRPDVSEVRRIYQTLQDKRILGRAFATLAGAQYIAGRYNLSSPPAGAALELRDEGDFQLECLRIQGLSSAYRGEKTDFEKTRKKTMRIIEQGGPTSLKETATALEGIGRGYALLGSPKMGLKILQQARQVVTEAARHQESAIIPRIQIARSQILVARYQRRPDLDFVAEVAKQGLETALAHGYQRHVEQIRGLLDEFALEPML